MELKQKRAILEVKSDIDYFLKTLCVAIMIDAFSWPIGALEIIFCLT